MTSLVVPVDVLAYCVGTIDHHGPVQGFAGGTTDFSNQSSGSNPPAFLGTNVVLGPGQTPLWSLETGVHVHWAMPDSLVRAGDDGKFPALPNRWLVTRIVGAGASARHWVVESDALSVDPPGGNAGPSVPVQAGADRDGATAADGDSRSFRYLGATTPLDSWTETLGAAAGRPLRAMTGEELTAVSTGSPGFCAYYPDARGVFGFWDDLGDVKDVPAELAYVVTGWYDLADNDPLAAGLSLGQLQTTLGWTYAGTAAEAPTRSLYSGLVQQIKWDPGTRYVDDSPEPVNADAAVGNTPGEALAAWLGGVLHPGLTAFEELMTLYSAGLLHILAYPGADQLALLEESLHALQFAGVDGGTIYTVTRGDAEATDLPLGLADALNALNSAQQACDLACKVEVQAKWQLFADWFRAFASSSDNKIAALNAFAARHRLQPAIEANVTAARTARDSAYASAKARLPDGMALTPVPAARYSQAAEPVLLLAGEAAAQSPRYGGDGRFHPSGYLVCRLDSDLLTGLSIDSSTLVASSYSALAPVSAQLPGQAAALVEEAALLNASVGSAASGVAPAKLLADLGTWVEGGAAQYYRDPLGLPPSPVALAQWDGKNPRPSLMLLWEADFHPLLDTGVAGTNYSADFFTASFQLDPNDPRAIAYSPGSGGIVVDPATIDFDPDQPLSGSYRYTGVAALSGASAANLRARIEADPGIVTDTTLQAIANLLGKTDVALRNLSGFNDALLSRERVLQLSAGTPSSGVPLPYRTITSQLLAAVPSLKGIPPLSPRIDGAYNGVRAGFMKLSLAVMDPFGGKRPVNIGKTYIADTMAAMSGGQKVDQVVYLQPRISQPTRLLWRWLAADGTEDDEMNDHPATTPVCGWLLPSHLGIGFFFYDSAGNPIGSLTLREDGSGIDWQPAPGNQSTVDEDLAAVMASQNRHLATVAETLGGCTTRRFRAMWEAMDGAVTQISPAAPNSASSLGLLVGRPLAVVEAALTLQREGLAALDQTTAALQNGTFADTDHSVGGIGFPVVIGDLARLDDGLVGYFKAEGVGYETDVFYTEAATGADPGVAAPLITNVCLTPQAAAADSPGTPPIRTRLLMLVDPRASVHATTGILPTEALLIPPEQYEGALDALEFTLLTTPLLLPSGGLTAPLPAVSGFTASYVTEVSDGGKSGWSVDPEVTPSAAAALWQYSPQSLTEGWLRLNPDELRFTVLASGKPVVTAGAVVSLTLAVRNESPAAITFNPGQLVGEDQPNAGSVLYVHFGRLVDADAVPAIAPSAGGWTFAALSDARHGAYWGATPAAATTLAPGADLTIQLANVAVSRTAGAQARIYLDYDGVVGAPDGVEQAILTILPPPAPGLERNP